MKITKQDSNKKIGEDETYIICVHCGKEYSKISSYGKHIQKHKANNTLSWDFE